MRMGQFSAQGGKDKETDSVNILKNERKGKKEKQI